MADNTLLIERVLKGGVEDIAFEAIPDENDSPLAQPVVSKTPQQEAPKVNPEPNPQNLPPNPEAAEQTPPPIEETDAPEQEVDLDPSEEPQLNAAGEEEFAIPLSHAKMMADTILGVTNNLLEIGGGYFVTVRKHKDFYEFDEVIQVIDKQNEKNVKRLKLDAEEKAMLRPLLIHVLRKKSKIITPEQQLLGVCLSLIIKRGKIVMEIRAENDILVERIREVIRKEMAQAKTEHTDEPDVDDQEDEEEQRNEERKDEIHTTQPKEQSIVFEEIPAEYQNKTGLPDGVLERMDD